MAFTPFSPRQPAASARLPLTLISLDDWALATLTGADAEKYLQGQVTADVSQMTEHQHLLAALQALYLERAQLHGCALDDAAVIAVLAMDIELNAQGLACWLDRISR